MRRTFTWLPWVLLILVIIGFVTWQQLQKPKAPVAADGVKMPAEKVEPLIDSTRMGGVGMYRDWETDRKSTRLNSSHLKLSRMPSSA